MLTDLTDVAALFSLRENTSKDLSNLHNVICMRWDLLEAPEYRQ
jgi:hypothetical protein